MEYMRTCERAVASVQHPTKAFAAAATPRYYSTCTIHTSQTHRGSAISLVLNRFHYYAVSTSILVVYCLNPFLRFFVLFFFFCPYGSAGLPQRLVSPRVPLIHTYLSIQMPRSDDEARRHLGINFNLRV